MSPLPAALFSMLLAAQVPAPLPTLPEILSRVAEEAEVLQQNAPKALTQETLEQRTMVLPPRSLIRVGKAATVAPKPRLLVREIVSEYSVGTLKESDSPDLVEFRRGFVVELFCTRRIARIRGQVSKIGQARGHAILVADFAKYDEGFLQRLTCLGRLSLR